MEEHWSKKGLDYLKYVEYGFSLLIQYFGIIYAVLLYNIYADSPTNFSTCSSLVKHTDFVLRGTKQRIDNGMIIVHLYKALDTLKN